MTRKKTQSAYRGNNFRQHDSPGGGGVKVADQSHQYVVGESVNLVRGARFSSDRLTWPGRLSSDGPPCKQPQTDSYLRG